MKIVLDVVTMKFVVGDKSHGMIHLNDRSLNLSTLNRSKRIVIVGLKYINNLGRIAEQVRKQNSDLSGYPGLEEWTEDNQTFQC